MNFKKNSFHFEGEPKIIKKNFVHNISNIKMLIKIVLFKKIKKIKDNHFNILDISFDKLSKVRFPSNFFSLIIIVGVELIEYFF